MKRILLITNADMSRQSGDVVLVLRRAAELNALYGAETDCVVVNKSHMNKKIPHQSPGIVFYNAADKRELLPFLKSGDHGLVIIFGEKAQLLIPYIRKKAFGPVRILIDMQGALEEQFEFSEKKTLALNYLKFLVKQQILRRAAGLSDGMIVVSEEMRIYGLGYVPRRKRPEYGFYKIRCGVGELLCDESRLQWRREIRQGWGIAESTTVMVFSGYRAAWQKTEEILDCFREYDRQGADVFFAFFCNMDDAFSKTLAESFPRKNYTLAYLSFQEHLRHLCACDIGFLVRDHNMTNRVAFPNKFSDYLNAGLLVAINDALPEPMLVLRRGGLEAVDIRQPADAVLTMARERREQLPEFYAACTRLCAEELLYKAQIVRSGIAALLGL